MGETYEAKIEVNAEIGWDGDQQVVLEAVAELLNRIDEVVNNFRIERMVRGEIARATVESNCAVLISLQHIGAC